MVKEIGAADFERDVVQLSAQMPVLVDFHAHWCGPCKMMSPILDAVAETLQGKVEIRKVDVDVHGELAQRFSVRGIPTMQIWKGGTVVETIVGMRAANDLQETLMQYA